MAIQFCLLVLTCVYIWEL